MTCETCRHEQPHELGMCLVHLRGDLTVAQARIAALMDTVDALKAAIDDGLSALNSSVILLTRVVEGKEALSKGLVALTAPDLALEKVTP